tara:strand:+ start:373 stop:684 length:312 start_codon:yes stop_codon:yes gene_type:complete
MNLEDQIKHDINTNRIILFLKGTKSMPMCGFSSTVVNILNAYEIEYKDVNVLEDPNIRVKLSEYSNWPTIPQLFVNGELIGGCDITVELFQNGELKKILGLED